MKETKNRAARDIIVVGFALFSMFFGAGNVIFPPYLGMESGPQWLAGFSAYFIADIGLALAAMFALLRVGSSEAVLQRVGCVPSEILMCAIILCVGPMVAIPRTSASTFEMAIAPNLPGVSAVVFSVLFFALILALCIRESAVVDIVGKVLTPLLLAGLAAIIIKGIVKRIGVVGSFLERRAQLIFVRKGKLHVVRPTCVTGNEQRMQPTFSQLFLQQSQRLHRQLVILCQCGNKAVSTVRTEPEGIAGKEIFPVHKVYHVPPCMTGNEKALDPDPVDVDDLTIVQ